VFIPFRFIPFRKDRPVQVRHAFSGSVLVGPGWRSRRQIHELPPQATGGDGTGEVQLAPGRHDL
jgi:hypothetical protein